MVHRQRLKGQIDSKLQAKINEKKQALGLHTERTQKPSYQTQEESERCPVLCDRFCSRG